MTHHMLYKAASRFLTAIIVLLPRYLYFCRALFHCLLSFPGSIVQGKTTIGNIQEEMPAKLSKYAVICCITGVAGL
jgi:hypothetical protein